MTRLICLLSIFATFFAFGCGSQPQTNSNTQQSTAQTGTPSVKGEEPNEKFKFKTANDAEALYIKRYSDHEKLEIDFGGEKATLKAKANDKGRLKYKSADDENKLIAEIKYKEDSIKLVDQNEKLLYKIKFSDDKIKIADNEEMNSALEMKGKSEEKTEIRDASGNEIGNVKFYADNGKLKVKDAQENEILILKNAKNSAAPGVILFNNIPVSIKCIMINEIMKKGR
ncbi:MAG: hypothetical protein ACOYXC_08410 [Candidatus Rifleibacteriota bacterium]